MPIFKPLPFAYICPNTPCLDCPYAETCKDYREPITLAELVEKIRQKEVQDNE